MRLEIGGPPRRSASQWIWLSSLVTLAGYGAIALTIYLNAATLFDYNGPVRGPEDISSTEAAVILEFLALSSVACVLLRKAWRSRDPGWFRAWHLIPILISCSTIVMALLASAFGVSEIIN